MARNHFHRRRLVDLMDRSVDVVAQLGARSNLTLDVMGRAAAVRCDAPPRSGRPAWGGERSIHLQRALPDLFRRVRLQRPGTANHRSRGPSVVGRRG
ncbi:MAG: hypothetical protein GY859_25790 [Desulfobacterales bacterium]|nr:hypothetical protein [Desulfobacterales bacterium]